MQIIHFKHDPTNETMYGIEGESFTTGWEDATGSVCIANYKPMYKTRGFRHLGKIRRFCLAQYWQRPHLPGLTRRTS